MASSISELLKNSKSFQEYAKQFQAKRHEVCNQENLKITTTSWSWDEIKSEIREETSSRLSIIVYCNDIS